MIDEVFLSFLEELQMSESLTERTVFTIIKDFHDVMFTKYDTPIKDIDEICVEVIALYIESSVKFKKPLAVKVVVKDKSSTYRIPVLENIPDIVWITDGDFSHTTTISLSGDCYPVVENESGKCVCASNSFGSRKLTNADKRVLSNFKISF